MIICTEIITSSNYLEEEFVVWPVEDIFKVGKSDSVRTNREFDKVGCVLVVDVIDHFRLLHRHTNSGATSHGNNLKGVLCRKVGRRGGCWWQVESVTSDKPAAELGLGRAGSSLLQISGSQVATQLHRYEISVIKQSRLFHVFFLEYSDFRLL